MVEHAPVQEGVDTSAVGDEICRAACRHDSNVFGDENRRCAPVVKDGGDVGHVAVRASVVVAKETHEQ